VRATTELDVVVADFLAAAATTRTRSELRELRGALSHVASELGTMDVGDVRARDVQALLDDLHAAGLPPSRISAVVEALRSLFAYAIRRGLVRTSPMVGMAPAPPEPAAATGVARTPTDAMLLLGGQLIGWTVKLIVIAFVLFAVALGVALA
jgi:hypothetical protein